MLGLALGPILAVFVYWLIPGPVLSDAAKAAGGLEHPGRIVAAIGVLMATYWVTEALPIAATGLIPLALFPLLSGGAISMKATAAPYANELIFLFMGGFMLALSMQKWALHRRIALHTILLVGTRPTRVVGGFMLATAFLSMWVSNTATAAMMMPIAISVVDLVRRELAGSQEPDAPRPGRTFNFAICLMLGTAYAASVGGIATLVGTPPNALLAAFVKENYGIEVSFVGWMAIGLPFAAVFLPVVWVLLTRLVYPIRIPDIPGGRALIRKELEAQGPMSPGERRVLLVFVLTAAAWLTQPLLGKIEIPAGVRPLAGLTDSAIAMIAAVTLFLIPVDLKRGVFLLDWSQVSKLPWGVLLLFGGGLSLASAIQETGVADLIAQGMGALRGLPTFAAILVVTGVIVFLTELTSNTAVTATFLPITAAMASGLNIDPLLLLVPMTVGATCAFMLPAGTPPNAIVFGTGEVTIPQMCKAGLWLNFMAIALLTLLAYGLVMPILGGRMH